jgi:hypothetical protein
MRVTCVTTCFWNGQYFEAGEAYTVTVPAGEALPRHLKPVATEQAKLVDKADVPDVGRRRR